MQMLTSRTFKKNMNGPNTGSLAPGVRRRVKKNNLDEHQFAKGYFI